MRRVSLESVQPGMIVARTIYSSEGRVLLTAGMELSEKYIKRLFELGLSSIYIKDEIFDSAEIVDVISEETRLETTIMVKNSFQALEYKQRMNIRAVKDTVEHLIDELLSNREIMINLVDIRTFDDYTFSHSVNVCVLSLMTGITRGFHQLKLMELGVGALLHDIGKIRLARELISKPGELTREEYMEIKRHCEYGYDILRNYDEMPLLSAHIAFQHHEQWHGKGYPRGLVGEEIHDYARIVAVADVYDALLADRPYRPAYSVNQAVTIISRMANVQLDPRSVASLVANIAIFPVGSVVKLNTGEIGIIMDVNKDSPTRPIIRVVFDRFLTRLKQPHEIDLTRLSTIYVAKSLSEEEIIELINESNATNGNGKNNGNGAKVNINKQK
ncbi:MAG: HD-GYP domain-containing protein [Chitinophagales bacterium]